MLDIQLYATLRPIAGRRKVRLDLGETTVGKALEELTEKYPKLQDAIFDHGGAVRSNVMIMVEGRDIRHLSGLETRVTNESAMDIFPPVAGGN